MNQLISQTRPLKIVRRSHRGQTLIVAIAVLFVLLFIGGIFVAQIARNLVAAGRSKDSQIARSFAEMGLVYCETQLMTTKAGADWRPTPTAPTVIPGYSPVGASDPDYYWLHDLHFTRLYVKGGRSLIRVTYDPHADDPKSQAIKVESVGRTGDLGSGTDPTIFVQNGPSPRLRSELVMYKPLGTEFARWITNKDHRNMTNFMGVSVGEHDLSMPLGDPDIALNTDASGFPTGISNNHILFGYPMRVGSDLEIGGDVLLYESPRGAGFNGMSEGLHVDGTIKLAGTRGTTQAPVNQVAVNQPIDIALGNNGIVLPSDSPNFDTLSGIIRDSSTGPDLYGRTRSISFLDPPNIDTEADGTGVSRYRAMTRDDGKWLSSTYNNGQGGWGTGGIYVGNFDDLQPETSTTGLNGGYSLRADWLNPKAGFAQGYWKGPFYVPPGALVELLGDRIRITRDDDKVFTYPDGSPTTQQGGKVIEIPLSDWERTHYQLPNGNIFPVNALDHDGDLAQNDPNAPAGYVNPFSDPNSYGVNLVLMLEGNVRVKGTFGTYTDPAVAAEDATHHKLGRVHLTIVTGGTAYIEGSLVKGDGTFSTGGSIVKERASSCAILAKDYVCVNTTMFMSPQNQSNSWSRMTPDLDAFNTQIGLTRQNYDTSFSFGVDPTTDYQTSGSGSPLYLMLRHAAMEPGPAYMNLMINPGLPPNDPAGPLDTLYQFSTGVDYPVGITGGNIPNPVGIAPFFEQKAFPLDIGNGQYIINPNPGVDNLLRFMIDQSGASTRLGTGGSTDYLLGAAMVVPMDVRIEAMLYAQERSFFVIPGYPLNPDPNDTRLAYTAKGIRSSYNDKTDTPADRQMKDLYPFYNEPADVRITLYGSIVENYSASASDQALWMARWGYFPAVYGSSAQPVPDSHMMGHDPAGYVAGEDLTKDFRTPLEKSPVNGDYPIARGLRYVYDPVLAMPYLNPSDAGLMDINGANTLYRSRRALRSVVQPAVMSNGVEILPSVRQVLPPIPRLPVCPGRLYFGESDRVIGS